MLQMFHLARPNHSAFLSYVGHLLFYRKLRLLNYNGFVGFLPTFSLGEPSSLWLFCLGTGFVF